MTNEVVELVQLWMKVKDNEWWRAIVDDGNKNWEDSPGRGRAFIQYVYLEKKICEDIIVGYENTCCVGVLKI